MHSSTAWCGTRNRPVHRVALAVYAIVSLAGVASAQAPTGQPPFRPALDSIFPLGERHNDFIVALDRSLSMRPLWGRVAEAVRTFVQAIPDGDHVSIVLFAKTATNSALLPRTLNASSRAALLEEIQQLGPPRPIVGTDAGLSTDLGAALSATVDEINRPGANRLQFVVLLTDFKHEPSAGSTYGSMDPSAAPWVELARRSAGVRAGKAVQSFALMLPLDAGAGRDLRLARSVLGDLTVVNAQATTLEEWFRRLAAEADRARFRNLAQADLTRGWEWRVTPQGRSTRFELRSQLTKLSLRVVLDSVVFEGGRAYVEAEGRGVVPPGAKGSFTVRARACSQNPPLWKWLATPGVSRRLAGAFRVFGMVVVEPAASWDEVGLASRRVLAVPTSAPLAVTACGAPLPYQVAAIVLLVALAVVFWRIWGRPVRPVRDYLRSVVVSGDGVRETIEVPRDGARTLTLGTGESADVCVPIPELRFTLQLFSGKPKFPRLRPPRGLYVTQREGGVTYDAIGVDPTTRRRGMRRTIVPDTRPSAVRVGPRVKLRVSDGTREFDIVFHR